MMSVEGSTAGQTPAPKWQPIGRVERRVLGVMVEKAKTTPDAYPLTLNALTTGCNQKSNRDPQMNLEPDQVETALERLRHLSAAVEVSGSGRVPKYRHLAYEWLGVNKPEAAVMTELLLRGPQTVGELRGRAARMEPIADVAALQPILQSLMDKGLVLSLTPPGRGQLVTHALFLPEEMEKIRHSQGAATSSPPAAASQVAPVATPVRTPPAATPAPVEAVSKTGLTVQDLQELRQGLSELREEIARLKQDVQDLWDNMR